MTGSKKRQIALARDVFFRLNELFSYWKKGLGQEKSVRLVKKCWICFNEFGLFGSFVCLQNVFAVSRWILEKLNVKKCNKLLGGKVKKGECEFCLLGVSRCCGNRYN